MEFDTVHRLGALPMLGVALIEESAKLVVPAVILLVARRYRRPADGVLIGVACGAGFAALETMGYAFVDLVDSRGDLVAVDGILLLRGLLSPAAHMAWTGLTAGALWYAVSGTSRHGVLRFLGVSAVAVALHTTWDSVGTLPVYAVAAVGLGLVGITVHRLPHRGTSSPTAP